MPSMPSTPSADSAVVVTDERPKMSRREKDKEREKRRAAAGSEITGPSALLMGAAGVNPAEGRSGADSCVAGVGSGGGGSSRGRRGGRNQSAKLSSSGDLIESGNVEKDDSRNRRGGGKHGGKGDKVGENCVPVVLPTKIMKRVEISKPPV